MITRAIYSYKILDDYWKGQSDTFYTLAKLSLKLAKRYYKTVLYCDRITDKKFRENGLIFDEVIILNSLREVNSKNYGLSKIYAMMEETEPYVILDLDTLIFEPINTTHTITYGYKEVEPEKISNKNYVNEYYLDSYNNFKDKIGFELDWLTFPNNSLVVVNNPFIVKEIYQKILKIIDGDYSKTTVQFYEQFLLYNYLKEYKVDVGFLYEFAPFSEFLDKYDVTNAIAKKFIHLDFYFRQPNSEKFIQELETHINNI